MICLKKGLERFAHRVDRLEALLRQGDALSGRDKDVYIASFLIELPTSFALLARSAYLAGAMSGRTARGICMTPRLFPSRSAALLGAAALFKKAPAHVPGRDEPSWQSLDHLARIAAKIGVANAADFVAATSMFPAAGTVVTATRNFYAHRTRHTLEKLRDDLRRYYAISLAGHPSDSLTVPLASRASPLVWEWAGNYRDMAEALCGA